MQPLRVGRSTMTDRRLRFLAGLIAALALAHPASSFAQQPATRDTVAWNDTDLLPFAHNEVPESFPSVGFSIGIGKYLSDFGSIEQAFHAIEDGYSAGGFSVPRARDVDLGPMVLPTLKLRLSRGLDVALQAGRAQEYNDQLYLMGGLISWRYAPSPAGRVSLVAGLGAGKYRFSFEREYGAQVTPVDGNGGYYRLDTITLEGGGGYWTTAGGLIVRAWPQGTLEAIVQYVGTGDVSTDATQAGNVRVNLSGAMIAVSITSYF